MRRVSYDVTSLVCCVTVGDQCYQITEENNVHIVQTKVKERESIFEGKSSKIIFHFYFIAQSL